MVTPIPKPMDRPFRVVAFFNGREGFAGGFMTEEEAEFACDAANARATEIKTTATYSVKPKPEGEGLKAR